MDRLVYGGGIIGGYVIWKTMNWCEISLDTHPRSSTSFITVLLCAFHILNGCIFQPMEDWGLHLQAKQRIENAMKAWAIGSFGFLIVGILFGVSPISDSIETIIWGAMMSSMVILPGGMLFGCEVHSWRLFIFSNTTKTEEEQRRYYAAIGAIFGAWVGAMLIPLDWDRPWQVWPLPCVYGGLIGYFVSIVFFYNLLYDFKLN
eukprot:TRINITY_DN6368_c0_g1_i1.p1 TRINITY_DN6368_c0_g1~~TRINITY_DN6368_c0_g1_i1.p1  ORF type:complete len:203 (+),score=58.58 TRINITY_DN6368_c0_g1_i1:48-656(+)